MKPLHLTLALFFLCFSTKAEDRVYERVYVHTDKDCYIAGEDIRLKFYVIDTRFQPSDLSKVGYVEICSSEKPLMQLKVALKKGSGAGTIKIPGNIPSGVYRLSGYTRYMRNEGEDVFFGKQIAVVNPAQKNPDPKQFELVEEYVSAYSENKESSDLSIKTDQSEYGNRREVRLSIDRIPANTADLVVSVTRNDSIARMPETNNREWLKQVTKTLPFSRQWIPEYEGHIITGRFVPDPKEELATSLAFVGNDIRLFNGQINPQNGTVNFYTAGIFDNRQVVTSAILPGYYDKAPYRLDLLSPFCESSPVELPVLQIYPNENRIMERYIGVQLQEKANRDFLHNSGQIADYCTFEPTYSYDLDEYTRFPTISETILEFVIKVRVNKIRETRRISVFKEDQRFSSKTLVLLDGVPVYNHEDILEYNPMHIKKINIYENQYMFGNIDFDCIVSFITKGKNLPYFQLTGESQLFNYECPQLPSEFDLPDYSTETAKKSGKPDFRHTLYWNPFVEATIGEPVRLSFYTSDLCGEFKVTVEGITTDGKMIRGVSYFRVK